MVCTFLPMWKCMSTTTLWGPQKELILRWRMLVIVQFLDKMVVQFKFLYFLIVCHTGLYIAPGTENLLSLEIFATNVTEDAVSFFKAGKQRNCYLDTDFQPPIFSKVSLIYFNMYCSYIFCRVTDIDMKCQTASTLLW